MRKDLFKDYTRADAIKAQEERERMRIAALDVCRRVENAAIIETPTEGCAVCLYAAKSVSTAEQKDICRDKYAYLPIYMDLDNQRPSWCPGFERNGDGLAAESIDHEHQEIEQQELPI